MEAEDIYPAVYQLCIELSIYCCYDGIFYDHYTIIKHQRRYEIINIPRDFYA